jgi:hypothetical protein
VQRAMPDPNSGHLTPPSLPRTSGSEPLQLQIVGTQRHGHVVEIPASRCTMGSAADCTVRLRAAGVRPIHCVIVRGIDGRIVRSLSADTWLNGRIFREQSLRAGDRLRLGPIEFVVLGESVPPIAAPEDAKPIRPTVTPPAIPVWTGPEASRPSEVLSRLNGPEQPSLDSPVAEDPGKLATQTAPADVERAPDESASKQAFEGPTTTAAETAASQRAAQFEQDLAARNAELEAIQRMLEDRTAQWEAARQSLQAELDAVRTECDRLQLNTANRSESQRDEISQLTAQLQQERQNLESARQAWSTDCDHLENQRRSLSQLHADAQERSRNEQVRFDMDRENWLTERLGLEQLLEDHRHRNAELELEAKLLTEQFHQYAARVEELEAQLAAQPQVVANPIDIPAATRNGNNLPTVIDSNVWQSGMACPPQSRSELAWLAQQFAATKTDVDATQESVEQVPTLKHGLPSSGVQESLPTEEPLDFEPTLREIPQVNDLPESPPIDEPAPIDERMEYEPHFTGRESMLADPEASNVVEDWSPATLETESADLSSPEATNPSSPQFDVRFLSNWQVPDELDESIPAYQPPSFERYSPEAVESPYDVTNSASEEANVGVFDRLQRAGIWRDQDNSDELSSPPYEDFHDESTGEPILEESRDVEVAAPAVEPGLPPKVTVEVEDSIESYMQRLLERVRGSDGPAANSSTYVFPAEERSPITEIEATDVVPEAAATPAPPVVEEKEYTPRSHAPESNINLSAMRELANDSRQRNMLSHAQRTWTAESAGKLLSAFAAFTVAFAAFFLRDIHSNLAAAGLIGGVGIGVFLLWQAFSLRRRLFDSLRLDTSDQEDSVDETKSTKDAENQLPRDESHAPHQGS